METLKKAGLFPMIIGVSVIQIALVIVMLVWSGSIKSDKEEGSKEKITDVTIPRAGISALMFLLGIGPMLGFDLWKFGKKSIGGTVPSDNYMRTYVPGLVLSIVLAIVILATRKDKKYDDVLKETQTLNIVSGIGLILTNIAYIVLNYFKLASPAAVAGNALSETVDKVTAEVPAVPAVPATPEKPPAATPEKPPAETPEKPPAETAFGKKLLNFGKRRLK